MTREARTAAISAATIVGLIAVSIAIAVQCGRPELDEPEKPLIPASQDALTDSAPIGFPEQLEAQKREDESRQWASELHKVLVNTPEYQQEFKVEHSALDDVLQPMDTALEELDRHTR